MNIPELKWVMNNRDRLSKEDYKALNSFDIFNQYDNNRQLEQSATNMLELVSLVGYIYEKHNNSNV